MTRHPLAVPRRQRVRWSDSPGTGIVFSSCHRRASLLASVPSCPSGGLHDDDVLLVAGRRRDDREGELHGASTSLRLAAHIVEADVVAAVADSADGDMG